MALQLIIFMLKTSSLNHVRVMYKKTRCFHFYGAKRKFLCQVLPLLTGDHGKKNKY